MSIIGRSLTAAGGGEDTYELLAAYSNWQSTTGSAYVAFTDANTDSTGEHFSEYLTIVSDEMIYLRKACQLAFVLTSRVANDTRRYNRVQLLTAPPSDPTSFDLILTATDNENPTAVLDFSDFPGAQRFQVYMNNATAVATVRGLQIWIRNP